MIGQHFFPTHITINNKQLELNTYAFRYQVDCKQADSACMDCKQIDSDYILLSHFIPTIGIYKIWGGEGTGDITMPHMFIVVLSPIFVVDYNKTNIVAIVLL